MVFHSLELYSIPSITELYKFAPKHNHILLPPLLLYLRSYVDVLYEMCGNCMEIAVPFGVSLHFCTLIFIYFHCLLMLLLLRLVVLLALWIIVAGKVRVPSHPFQVWGLFAALLGKRLGGNSSFLVDQSAIEILVLLAHFGVIHYCLGPPMSLIKRN